mmetsp:Transcript_16205/g.51537  ORF Transcript_16205/g.51537 Transcript_16205/m.51537 type:complete len:271 (+) Transcript_16205:647-1459(+)
MCSVPPVRKPGKAASAHVSGTMPCPLKAASPCSSTLTALRPSSRLHRVLPCATGLMASRWDGLGSMDTCSGGAPAKDLSKDRKRCEDTSSTSSHASGNSEWPSTLVNSLCAGRSSRVSIMARRPRWGMPSTTSVTPLRASSWNMVCRPGNTLSAPSPEYRLKLTNLRCMNSSYSSAIVINVCAFSSSARDAGGTPPWRSSSAASHARSSTLSMCSISTAMDEQYTRRRLASSDRAASPSSCTARATADLSSTQSMAGARPSGSMRASRWP